LEETWIVCVRFVTEFVLIVLDEVLVVGLRSNVLVEFVVEG